MLSLVSAEWNISRRCARFLAGFMRSYCNDFVVVVLNHDPALNKYEGEKYNTTQTYQSNLKKKNYPFNCIRRRKKSPSLYFVFSMHAGRLSVESWASQPNRYLRLSPERKCEVLCEWLLFIRIHQPLTTITVVQTKLYESANFSIFSPHAFMCREHEQDQFWHWLQFVISFHKISLLSYE